MKVKFKLKETTATTQYVQIDSGLKKRILDDLTKMIIDWRENYDTASNAYSGIIFNPNSTMPKLGTGNNRSKGTGYNSIYSYIGGIVENHVIGSKFNNGKKTSDFTDENIKWIGIVSTMMQSLDPDTYTEYEFVDEDKLDDPADTVFGA